MTFFAFTGCDDPHPCDLVYQDIEGELVPMLDGEDVTEFRGGTVTCEDDCRIVFKAKRYEHHDES